ncbi:DUF2842 domain-containing protein [Sedimentimonas flavescens]|uniref:DUF2842 domain-containing protein n=1 Tax=Sedimentimonas flavescens TaxID=2851012 RepID=A0ABT2ZXE7_9RHOB|nr:DUF2842 domain-containing protein [Sedimentimonas flavescens]MBW0158837.1 DUF2842 domain-containing protein [Sedimentimonas flavescens]MCV2878184.1 DUF2842 domain-containing protein [Sedimentimonas flavescens]
MALSYKARRRLSILVLVVGLPLYIVVAVTLTGWLNERFGRLPIWAELLVYVGLGFLWMLPLKPVFSGVGREDPDAKK